ncbi:hypothetical protein HF086_003669, partial [Spodoptera exigua]
GGHNGAQAYSSANSNSYGGNANSYTDVLTSLGGGDSTQAGSYSNAASGGGDGDGSVQTGAYSNAATNG